MHLFAVVHGHKIRFGRALVSLTAGVQVVVCEMTLD